MNWFTEYQGNILDRFDLYLDGDYRPWVGCGLDKLKWEDGKEIIFDELHELGEACKIRVVAVEPPRMVVRF